MNAVNEEMFEQYAQNMLPLVRVKEANSAGIMPNGNLAGVGQQYVAPPTLFERMFGRSAAPTDVVNPENTTATVSQTPRVGGIFPDIAAGYRENRNTPISLNNFGQNDLGGDRKKGFAYRLGEGLGSLARLGESPLGRGLLVGGLVLGTGGGALPALAFGGATSMGNQQHRMRDRAYRDDLIRGEQETIMGSEGFDKLDPATKQMLLNDAANRVNNYRGYITNDVYRNMVDSRIARENAAYRRMYYDNQRKNDEALLKYKQQEAEAKAKQQNIDNAFKNRELNIKENELAKDLQQGTQKGETVLNQLQLLENAFSKMPQSTAKVGQKGKAILTGASNLVGLRNNNVTAYEAIRNPLVTTLARSIAGEKGVLTDRDFARAEKMVPTAFDSPEQAQAKFEEIRKLVGVSLGGNVAQMGSTTKSGVKYEVID